MRRVLLRMYGNRLMPRRTLSPTVMIRLDRGFARYLAARAAREKVTVTEISRRILRALTTKRKAWAP